MRNTILEIFGDLAFVLGVGLVVFGVYQIYKPAAYICGGLTLVALSILIATKIAKPGNDQS